MGSWGQGLRGEAVPSGVAAGGGQGSGQRHDESASAERIRRKGRAAGFAGGDGVHSSLLSVVALAFTGGVL